MEILRDVSNEKVYMNIYMVSRGGDKLSIWLMCSVHLHIRNLI